MLLTKFFAQAWWGGPQRDREATRVLNPGSYWRNERQGTGGRPCSYRVGVLTRGAALPVGLVTDT